MTRCKRWCAILTTLLLLAQAVPACSPSGTLSPTPAATPPPAAPVAKARCGDGVCDNAEQANPNLCPQDCPPPTEGVAPPSPTALPPTVHPTAPAALRVSPPPGGQTATRPNIVFILTDDLDYAAISYMPKLQALLTDKGTTLTNFFISMPLCCPSRATILRGQYAHNTQIMGNDLPFGGFPKFMQLNEEESTVATWLSDVGYRTMLAGKYLNAFPMEDDLMHIPPGWSEWYGPVEGVPYAQFNYSLNENGQLFEYGEEPQDYGTDVYARKSIGFMERAMQSGQPFFAHISVYAPHYPTTPAPRHAQLFSDAQAPRTPNYNEDDVSDKPSYIRGLPPLSDGDVARIDEDWRNRLRSMQSVDEMIESIVQSLESAGQLDNTYLFFTSDNGYHFGNHRQLLGKASPYEEEIRVTMIVRGPGVPAGRTLEHLTGNIDLAPTWAELAGAEPPDFVDGRSLLPLLGENPPSTDQWRQSFLIELAPYDLPGRTQPASATATNTPEGLLEPADPDNTRAQTPGAAPTGAQVLPYRGIRTARYVYIEYPTDERELYDLQSDRYQLQNLVATAKPELLAELKARLHELQSCSGDECRAIEDKPFTY